MYSALIVGVITMDITESIYVKENAPWAAILNVRSLCACKLLLFSAPPYACK